MSLMIFRQSNIRQLNINPTLVFRTTSNPTFEPNPFGALKNNLLPVFQLILDVDLPTTFIYQHLNGPAEWPVPFAKASPPKKPLLLLHAPIYVSLYLEDQPICSFLVVRRERRRNSGTEDAHQLAYGLEALRLGRTQRGEKE